MVAWCAGWKGSNKVVGALNLVDRTQFLIVALPYPSTTKIPRLALADGKEKLIWEYQSMMLEKIKKLIPNIDPKNRIIVGSSSGAHLIGTALARDWDGFTDYFTAYVLYGGGVAPGTRYRGAKGKDVLMAWGEDSTSAESREIFAKRMKATKAAPKTASLGRRMTTVTRLQMESATQTAPSSRILTAGPLKHSQHNRSQ